MDLKITHTDNLISVKARIGKDMYELTTWKGGRLEVYQEYSGKSRGVFRFVGYYDDLCKDPKQWRLCNRVHILLETHLQEQTKNV